MSHKGTPKVAPRQPPAELSPVTKYKQTKTTAVSVQKPASKTQQQKPPNKLPASCLPLLHSPLLEAFKCPHWLLFRLLLLLSSARCFRRQAAKHCCRHGLLLHISTIFFFATSTSSIVFVLVLVVPEFDFLRVGCWCVGGVGFIVV